MAHKEEQISLPLIKKHSKAYILDPTISFEKDSEQATEVVAEKRAVYEPCLCISVPTTKYPFRTGKLWPAIWSQR